MVEWLTDPELLRTFLAVRDTRNLTHAADRLHVSQPAVSRRVGRLERSLGLPLFERMGKRLHLTEAGEALAREAVALLGAMGRIGESVRARKHAEQGRLRIGASTTPGLYVLPAVVARFRAKHPSEDLHYAVENSLTIEEKILRNDLDLGLVGAHLAHEALRLKPVLRDEIVLYAAVGHPLARARSVSGRDLAREVGVVREHGSATRGLVDAWLARAHGRPAKTIVVGCPEAAKVLVRAGVGFSYVSALGLRGVSGAGLQRLNVPGMRVTRPLFLALHRDKQATPLMLAFLRMVEDETQRLANGA